MDKHPSHLSDSEALTLLSQFGANELQQEKKVGFWVRSSKMLREPMLLLLIIVSAIYLFMGSLGEGLMLGLSVFVVIGISLYQERKSEKALAALRQLSSPRALVIRSGEEKRIAATELVPGDLVVLHEGDRVPSDGTILQSTNLKIDESLLTGESFPAEKAAASEVFSSTLVISGTAYYRATKTGALTEVGKIGKSLQEIVPDELNLNKEIRQIVRLFAWSGFIICLVIILIYGFTHHVWVDAILVGLSTEMALLPEEFPVVLTLFLAMGAWRLSKIQVLIRRPGSIERLGAVTVLCVDKTGTLTQNRMSIASLNNDESSIDVSNPSQKNLPEAFHPIIEFGVLASHRDPFDPMEKAIRRIAEENDWGKEHLHQDWELIKDYPLSPQLLAMSCVWKSENLNSYLIAAKGAPEAVIDLCHLPSDRAKKIALFTQEMAKNGLRVLGVAKAIFPKTELPTNQHDFQFEWVGLIGLEDPLRPEVPDAIQLCRNAGVRVIMMTGDHPETALKIAERAGLDTINSLMIGTEVNSLSDDELADRLKTTHVFARMVPDQKLRIVKALKKLGHVVGMTGDGVNDAPSLKWADIGIAMGARGTDVAREASDIVLLDDNFASIVAGIQRGRVIFNNIRKAMSYIVSIHVPIAGLSILPVLLGWPLILFPAHIVFLELLIDPACSLMFESQDPEEGMMSLPPRSLQSRLFTGRDLLRSFLQGGLVLGVAAAIYHFEISTTSGNPDHARTLAFVILAVSNLGLIFADMSGGSFRQLKKIFQRKSNLFILLGVTFILFLLTQIARIRALFHFGPLSILEFCVALGVAIVIFILISLWNKTSRYQNMVS